MKLTSVFSINIPTFWRLAGYWLPRTLPLCSSASSKVEVDLIVPFRLCPWNSKTMTWSEDITIPLKALIKFRVISSEENCSAISRPRRRNPTSMSTAWRNEGADGWGGGGRDSTVAWSPVSDNPIHWRCRADGPMTPGRNLPVLSWLSITLRLKDFRCEFGTHRTVKA